MVSAGEPRATQEGGGGRRLTRSMLSRGLALLRMRMICLIWPWVTLLLMQPNTTSALGCRDGLYWKANLQPQKDTSFPLEQEGRLLPEHASAARRVQMTRGSYFWASSVHWSNHLQAGMSLMQA